MPKLTLGMPAYKEYEKVWFTLQALRMYQDLNDTEILVVDNFGDKATEDLASGWAKDKTRYVKRLDCKGPAAAKNAVFEEAKGDWVICMDSHVLLNYGVVRTFRNWTDSHPDCVDLLGGPLVYDDLKTTADSLNDEWRGQFWGTWRNRQVPLHMEYEIPMHGCGLFASRRDSWLGFHPDFRGFCGEEGYIHYKYKQAGRKTWLLGFLRWCHHFRNGGTPYSLNFEDRVRNYVIGAQDLGLPLDDIIKEFGEPAVTKAVRDRDIELSQKG